MQEDIENRVRRSQKDFLYEVIIDLNLNLWIVFQIEFMWEGIWEYQEIYNIVGKKFSIFVVLEYEVYLKKSKR